MATRKDTLFTDEHSPAQDFRFTEQVAEIFDDMLARSVPFYRETTAMAAELAAAYLRKNDTVYDLGCSTGATLIELARRLEHLSPRFVGVDNSPAMIDKARRKAQSYAKAVDFICADIIELELEPCGAVVMNYTLQFVRPPQRPAFVKKIYNALRPGGILLLSEKTVAPDSPFNRDFIRFYLNFKRRQGYSEIEISRKREALENVLIPFSVRENIEMLRQAGFAGAEQFFQWFNFSCFVAKK